MLTESVHIQLKDCLSCVDYNKCLERWSHILKICHKARNARNATPLFYIKDVYISHNDCLLCINSNGSARSHVKVKHVFFFFFFLKTVLQLATRISLSIFR